MPKMKTKSSAKKRFSFTASGKVKSSQANHAHKLHQKSQSNKRRQRGTTILSEAESGRMAKWLPNG